MIELNKLYNEDCIFTMKNRLLNKSIDGIVFSPPYNFTQNRTDCYYNNGYVELDNLSETEYISTRLNEFREYQRILKKDGVICCNLSYCKDNPILPTLLMAEIHKNTNLTVVDVLYWKKKTAIPFQTSPNKLSRIIEPIYVIVNKDEINSFKTNKSVSKINPKTNQKFYKNYTNIIEAANNDGITTTLKASYSQDMCLKLFNIYFKKNEVVYDPFSGIGTTALACITYELNYIGSEIKKELYDIAINRLNEVDCSKRCGS